MVSAREASASVAIAWIGSIGVPSLAYAMPGAVISGVATSEPVETPSKSNQSPGAPCTTPQGSEGSPATYVFAKKKPSQDVPNPVPNPKGFRAPPPIWSLMLGEPETTVTGIVP